MHVVTHTAHVVMHVHVCIDEYMRGQNTSVHRHIHTHKCEHHPFNIIVWWKMKQVLKVLIVDHFVLMLTVTYGKESILCYI